MNFPKSPSNYFRKSLSNYDKMKLRECRITAIIFPSQGRDEGPTPSTRTKENKNESLLSIFCFIWGEAEGDFLPYSHQTIIRKSIYALYFYGRLYEKDYAVVLLAPFLFTPIKKGSLLLPSSFTLHIPLQKIRNLAPSGCSFHH